MMTFNGDGGATHYQWVYLAFNWLGALLAVFVYECIFRRAENAVQAAAEDGLSSEESEGRLLTSN
jgi:hypothetical protein